MWRFNISHVLTSRREQPLHLGSEEIQITYPADQLANTATRRPRSLEPGARVVDVTRRHDVVPHQLSFWRRQAREGILALPFEAMPGLSESGDAEPAFVPLAIAAESSEAVNTLAPPKLPEAIWPVLALEIGPDVVMRVPGDVPVERVAALVWAM